jgi:hypothetical protein
MAQRSNPVPELSRFENHDVLSSTISVTNAGDGLSAALSVDPAEYQLGDTVFVVLETRVAKVTYTPSKDSPEARIRVHTLKTEHASVVDGQTVAGLLADTKRKLAEKAEAEEEAKGVQKIPGTKVTDINKNRGAADDTGDEPSE